MYMLHSAIQLINLVATSTEMRHFLLFSFTQLPLCRKNWPSSATRGNTNCAERRVRKCIYDIYISACLYRLQCFSFSFLFFCELNRERGRVAEITDNDDNHGDDDDDRSRSPAASFQIVVRFHCHLIDLNNYDSGHYVYPPYHFCLFLP